MVEQSTKDIYNLFLSTSRSRQDKPFKYRKNFDDFEESYFYPGCVKLDRLFKQCPHINPRDYFAAPFDLYDDFDGSFDFYVGRSGIKAYTTWIKKMAHLPPDDEFQLSFAKRSFIYMKKYCGEHSLPWETYLESSDVVPHWVRQLKQRDVSIYSLMAFDGLRDAIYNLDEDIASMMIKDYRDNYTSYKRAYIRSKKMRSFVEKAHEVCKIKIKTSSTSR